MSSLLTMDDFKGLPNCSAFEALLQVAQVASLKLAQSKDKTQNLSESKEKRKGRGLKRSYAEFDDNEKEKEKNRMKTKKKQSGQGPNPPPDLPEEFKKRVEEMGGSEVSLLIQKTLYRTDLSPQHNRLSLPLNQIKNPHFLRRWESQLLNNAKNQSLDVVLIEPSLRTTGIVFGKWDMTKSSSYILRSSWSKVARANGLVVNDAVQVWSFRVRHQLGMALVKLPLSH